MKWKFWNGIGVGAILGHFSKDRIGRPEPWPDQSFWNWNRLSPRVFAEKPSPSCMHFRIWLIWQDIFFYWKWNSHYDGNGLTSQSWQNLMESTLSLWYQLQKVQLLLNWITNTVSHKTYLMQLSKLFISQHSVVLKLLCLFLQKLLFIFKERWQLCGFCKWELFVFCDKNQNNNF